MKTNVLIIGGGAIGSAVAYYLKIADPQSRVTVVEKDPTYSFASSPRAAGGVRRLFSTPENIELSNYSIPFFENIDSELSVGSVKPNISFKKNGYLFIVPPEDTDILKKNYELQLAMGCNVRYLEPSKIKELWPSMNVEDLGAAAYSPDDGWLDPYALMMGFRNKAIELETLFVSDEVIGFERSGNLIKSAKLASGNSVRADTFVNAAGAWAKEVCSLLSIKIPIEPLKRYEHYFECQEKIEPLPYIKDPKRLAFRPEGEGYTGGVPSLEEKRGIDFEIKQNYFDEVVWPMLAHRFAQFDKTKLVRTMAGLYDQNDFDGNVIIGSGVDGLENFHLLTGFSGHGLMHTPGCGRAMAELILTGSFQTIDLSRFGWNRIVENRPIRETGII